MFDSGLANDFNALRDELRTIAADLKAARAPAEPVFLSLGNTLSDALGLLQGLGAEFAQLAESLESVEAAEAATALQQGVAAGAALAAETAQALTLLRELGEDSAAGARPLAMLAKVVSEVHALSINARIEAAQVRVQGVDFTVFTTEISRLGRLAGDAVGKATERFTRLGPAIAEAIAAEDRFQRVDGCELQSMCGRLGTSLTELGRRRHKAGEAATAVAERSRRIAERVSACVVALQINDLTSQRIEHVVEALDLLGTILAGEEFNPARKAALVAEVCRLQSRQLQNAGVDFGREVGGLKGNLAALADDAESVLDQARAMTGSQGSGRSFVGALRDDVERATGLLDAFGAAERRVQELVGTVSEGFTALDGELVAIHSIDADMRIMGLNASLKCARLGAAGRSLGVVAQELRGCSRRTEETIRAVSKIIAGAVSAATTLTDCSRHENEDSGALAAGMAGSMEALCHLGDAVEAGVARLGEDCGRASALLAGAAASIAIDGELPAAASLLATRLAAVADAIGPIDAAAIRDDVLRLLEGRYTMASERMIHNLFAEGEGAATADASAAPGAGGDDFDAFLL
jgi:hypothetical protein